MITTTLRARLGDLRLFTVIATLGALLEVGAANLATETFVRTEGESSGARLRKLGRLSADARRSARPALARPCAVWSHR
jgi:hypothetical protein